MRSCEARGLRSLTDQGFADGERPVTEADEPELDNLPTYVVPSTGAILTYQSAIPLLSEFCSLLPTDPFAAAQKPEFEITGVGLRWKATLRLPMIAALPGKRVVVGFAMATKKASKQAAAFEICVELHAARALDDHLLPIRFVSFSASYEWTLRNICAGNDWEEGARTRTDAMSAALLLPTQSQRASRTSSGTFGSTTATFGSTLSRSKMRGSFRRSVSSLERTSNRSSKVASSTLDRRGSSLFDSSPHDCSLGTETSENHASSSSARSISAAFRSSSTAGSVRILTSTPCGRFFAPTVTSIGTPFEWPLFQRRRLLSRKATSSSFPAVASQIASSPLSSAATT